jgi:hypothetical protein
MSGLFKSLFASSLLAAFAFPVGYFTTQGRIVFFEFNPFRVISLILDGVIFVVALGAFQRDMSAAFTFFCHEGFPFLRDA